MTNNIVKRLAEHNSHTDKKAYTYNFRPWKLEFYISTDSKHTAEIAERYFKNRAGREKFEKYLEQNPHSQNPVEDYFCSLETGKSFGKRANGTRFKLTDNDGLPFFAMA